MKDSNIKTLARLIYEKEEINEIIEEGFPLPPTHATHFYTNNLEDGVEVDVEDLEDEDIGGNLESSTNITILLKYPKR